MRQPGSGRARFDDALAARCKRLTKHGIEKDARSFGANRDLDFVSGSLCGDIEPPTAYQRVAGEQREVEEQSDSAFRDLLVGDRPAELDSSIGAEQPLDRRMRLARIDLLPEAATCTERQAEEFQLVGCRTRAVAEQFQALFAHVRVGLVGEQLDAVVERAHRRHEVVAKPRAKQAGKVKRIHSHRQMRQSLIWRKVEPLKGSVTNPIFMKKMGGHQTIDVRLGPAHAGWRLDRALAAVVPTISRERLKTMIRGGAVERHGSAIRDPALKVKGDEALRLAVPEPKPAHNEPQDIPLPILFEDEHLLVVEKPAGLVVHPAAGNPDGTLVNALLHHCAGKLSGIGGVARPGIVHRIDKDTSGLLVVAKTDVAHEGLAKQFAAHSIDRRYLAIVSGVPAMSEGSVDAPLARSASNRKKIAIVRGNRGKRAVTHWKRLEALHDAALVECRLETGRTHQVRVHMASIGHPLIGDPVYGRTRKAHGKLLRDLDFDRQALHAAELGFCHPVTKHRLSFSSRMPPDMQELKDALGVVSFNR